MNEDLSKSYIGSNDIFGLPQTYKGLEFYPVKIKDMKYYTSFYNLFTYPKNFVADKDVIKMSYLRFIIAISADKASRDKTIKDIENFFKYVTRRQKVKIETRIADSNREYSVENSIAYVVIDDVEISEWEFEELREIVLEQNGSSIEYVNQYHPELEQKLMRSHGNSDIDFADQIFTLSILLHKNPEEIGEYTIYQLQNIFDRMITLKQFDLYQPLLATGEIKMQGGELKHYLYHRGKKGRYEDILIASETFFDKNKDILGK